MTKNPAGWLRKAIEEDYVPPKEYESLSDRTEKEKRQAKRAQVEAEQRRSAEQEYLRLKELALAKLRDQHPSHPVSREGITTETAWSIVLADLKEKVTSTAYQSWFKDTVLIEVSGDLAVIGVPNRFAVQQLERHYGGIARSLGDVLKREVEVQFMVLDSLEEE